MTRRLLLAYLTITAFALVVVVVPLGLPFASRERARLLFDLERDAEAVSSRSEDALEGSRSPDLEGVFADFDVAGGRIVVVDDEGLTVADSAPDTPLGRDYATRPEIAAALNGERVSGMRHSETLDTDLAYVAVPVASGGTVHGAVRITLPSSAVDDRVRSTWIRLGLLSVVVLATVGGVGLLLATSVTRPVLQLEEASKRLAEGDLGARVGEIHGAPELVALGQQFDATAERLAVLKQPGVGLALMISLITALGVFPPGIYFASLTTDVKKGKGTVGRLLPGVRELAARGIVTGASGRNWAAYGDEVQLPPGFADTERALLTDPQTSGGLLVACAPDTVDAVLATFQRHGFERAASVGRVEARGKEPLDVTN